MSDMAIAPATAMSLEEFAAMPDETGKQELDRGELKTMAPPQIPHSDIAGNIFYALSHYARTTGFGQAHAEAGFILSVDPPVVRQPDVSFLTAEQVARKPVIGWVKEGPALVFEVVLPSQSARDLETKAAQYLAAGSQAVVTVYPESRSAWVHRPDGTSRRLQGDDALSFPEILGDWSLPFPEIFPAAKS